MIERDFFGYLLYTAWRSEQLLKEMEPGCMDGVVLVDWPWNAIVDDEEENRSRNTARLEAAIRMAEMALSKAD